jgi:hypothetical protein
MPGHQIPLNSGIRYPSVTSVENTFLCGMQSSEPSFILTSTGRAQRRIRELQITDSLNQVKLSGFRDDPFGLSFVSSHRPSDNTARTKILDRTACRNPQQLDRLCNRISNVTAWFHSSEPVLHLRIRVQHAPVAQGTNPHKSRSGTATGIAVTPIHICESQKGLISAPTQSTISSEVNICNKIGLPEEHYAR